MDNTNNIDYRECGFYNNNYFNSKVMEHYKEQLKKDEMLWCDRQEGSSGNLCKCICHQSDYELPSDFNKVLQIIDKTDEPKN